MSATEASTGGVADPAAGASAGAARQRASASRVRRTRRKVTGSYGSTW